MSLFYYRLFCTFTAVIMLMKSFDVYAQGCEKVKLTDFPKSDFPSIIDTSHSIQEKLKVQGSYKFYYGIGVPVDYVKARYLAEAEIEGRVEHLKNMKSGELKGIFDLCDDITSGYMFGFCESVHSELESIRRKAIIDSVITGWTEKDLEAYSSLRKAASSFHDARVMSEVDMSGTARAAEEIGESELLEERFKDNIITASKCAVNPHTEQQWEAADLKLNAVYGKIMNSKSKDLAFTYVTKEGIRSVQRAWIRYRDAWVIFGAVRCPEIAPIILKTMITEERTWQLEELLKGL